MSTPSKEAMEAAAKMLREMFHDNTLAPLVARALDAFAAEAVKAREAEFNDFLRWECGKDKAHLWMYRDGTEPWSAK